MFYESSSVNTSFFKTICMTSGLIHVIACRNSRTGLGSGKSTFLTWPRGPIMLIVWELSQKREVLFGRFIPLSHATIIECNTIGIYQNLGTWWWDDHSGHIDKSIKRSIHPSSPKYSTSYNRNRVQRYRYLTNAENFLGLEDHSEGKLNASYLPQCSL